MATKKLEEIATALASDLSLTGHEQGLLFAAGGKKLVDLGDILMGYMGFIDPHWFGAKGDTVEYADGICVSGSNDFESSTHIFTSSDIGKCFYSDIFGSSRRTIIAVNVGGNPKKITFSGAAAAASGSDRYWIMGTDDTAALRAALQAAGKNRGKGVAGGVAAGTKNKNFGSVVGLRPAANYLVRNTSAEYAGGAGVLGALAVLPRTGIVGLAGPRSAQITISPDNYGYGIYNSPPDAFSDFLTFSNFCIDGVKGLSTANNMDALRLDLAFNGYDEVDAYLNVWNMDVVNSRGNGIYFNGRGEAIFSHIRVTSATLIGVLIDGAMDSTFIGMNSGGCSKTGIKVNRTPSSRFVGCKSYYNGANGAAIAGDCANWWITGDDFRNSTSVYSACEAQESRGSSFLIEGGLSIFSGCVAGDPGRLSIAGGTLPAVRAGFELSGTKCRYNTFSACVAQPSVKLFSGVAETPENETDQPDRNLRNWGWGTDAVFIDGNASGNRGDIYSYPLTDYDTGFGPKNGAGVSNTKNTALRVDGVALT